MTLRLRLALLSLAAAFVVFALPHTVHAATSPVTGKLATITFSGRTTAPLHRQHVRVSVSKPSTRSASYHFPVAKKGSFDFDKPHGNIWLQGALNFRRGHKTVKLKNLLVGFSSHRTYLNVTLGHRRVRIATLIRRHEKVTDKNGTRTYKGIRVRLTHAFASYLRRHARIRVPAGSVGGHMTLILNTPGTGTNGSITVAPGFQAALSTAGITPLAILPASLAPDGTLTTPLASATVSPDGTSAKVDMQGGLELKGSNVDAQLQNPELIVGGTDQGFYAQVNGVRVKIADLDLTGEAQSTLADGNTQLSGIALKLNAAVAPLLNTLFGTTGFNPGDLIGQVSAEIPTAPTT